MMKKIEFGASAEMRTLFYLTLKLEIKKSATFTNQSESEIKSHNILLNH